MRGDPVQYLNNHFEKYFDVSKIKKDSIQEELQNVFGKIENKEMNKCPICNEVKDIKAFYDEKFNTKYGKHCMECNTGVKVVASINELNEEVEISHN